MENRRDSYGALAINNSLHGRANFTRIEVGMSKTQVKAFRRDKDFGDGDKVSIKEYMSNICTRRSSKAMHHGTSPMDNYLQRRAELDMIEEKFVRNLHIVDYDKNERDVSDAVKDMLTPNLKHIMEGQQISRSPSEKEYDIWNNLNPDHLATELAKQKLFAIFPNIVQNTLVEILYAHDNKYEDTVETLLVSTGPGNIKGSLAKMKEPPIISEVLQEMKDTYKNNCNEVYEERREATFYRAEASKYHKRLAKLYEKANKYGQRGMAEVGQFYSSLAGLQTEYRDRANSMAVIAILDEHSKNLQDSHTLDLHYLYVKEAIPVLDQFLDRNINLLRHSPSNQCEYLRIITGHGMRSANGIAKIKPAVQARLVERNICYELINPGLLQIKITKFS